MELTLGSITYYLNLRRHESAAPGETPRWLPVEYHMSRVPWTLAGSWRARRALKPNFNDIDGAFVHTTTIGLLCEDLLDRKPIVLSTDGTPLQKKSMREAYGQGSERPFVGQLKHAFYRRCFQRAAGFVTWSNWSRDSLIRDYGLRPEAVEVIPPGVTLTDFTPGNGERKLPRILFVGGDFRRKGGHLLLSIFRKRLRGRAELVIITREAVPVEEGVYVHSGITANSPKLRELYASSDIFALPTNADCYSLVCIEALAAGLPAVSTRVGGIPDVIQQGKTGFLVEPGDEEALGDALELLVSDAGRRREMASACREDAARRFSAEQNARRLFEFVRSRC
jgi:glycosyltransferase involved in cell wall biosynthesis